MSKFKSPDEEDLVLECSETIRKEQIHLIIFKGLCYCAFGLGIVSAVRWSVWIGVPLMVLGAFLLAWHDVRQWAYLMLAIYDNTGQKLKDKAKRKP